MEQSQGIFDIFKVCRLLQIRREQGDSVMKSRYDEIMSSIKIEFMQVQEQDVLMGDSVKDESSGRFIGSWSLDKAELLALAAMTIKERQSSKKLTPKEIVDVASGIIFAMAFFKIYEPESFEYEHLEAYLKEETDRFTSKAD